MDDHNRETYEFMWNDTMPKGGFRHMLLTMHHVMYIENDDNRLNFLGRAMLDFLREYHFYKEVMMVPLNRTTGTSGKDITIIDDLNFIRAIRLAG